MNIEQLRKFCLSLPHVTEDVKWGKDLCFLIGGKMFCVTGLEPSGPAQFSFKCTPEKFAELIEIDGIIPAPYVARYHWVAVQDPKAIPDDEITVLIKTAYDLIFAKLPARIKQQLA